MLCMCCCMHECNESEMCIGRRKGYQLLQLLKTVQDSTLCRGVLYKLSCYNVSVEQSATIYLLHLQPLLTP